MRLDEFLVLHIVAINTKRGSVFGEVVGKLALGRISGFVNNVAGVTTTVERRMTAATLGNMHADVMTVQAEVVRLVTRHWLQQQRRVFRRVGIVALQTITRIGSMNPARERGRVLVFVA